MYIFIHHNYTTQISIGNCFFKYNFKVPFLTFIQQFYLSHVTVTDPDAVTRADFTRTSVTVPSVTRQSNSILTKFLLGAPKEIFTSKNILK